MEGFKGGDQFSKPFGTLETERTQPIRKGKVNSDVENIIFKDK
jgi:hypothetical protein